MLFIFFAALCRLSLSSKSVLVASHRADPRRRTFFQGPLQYVRCPVGHISHHVTLTRSTGPMIDGSTTSTHSFEGKGIMLACQKREKSCSSRFLYDGLGPLSGRRTNGATLGRTPAQTEKWRTPLSCGHSTLVQNNSHPRWKCSRLKRCGRDVT